MLLSDDVQQGGDEAAALHSVKGQAALKGKLLEKKKRRVTMLAVAPKLWAALSALLGSVCCL
jgi:hypothetical protein